MCHTSYFLWKFLMSCQIGSIKLNIRISKIRNFSSKGFVYDWYSYKGHQMWNAEDRHNEQFENHLNLTYCLNVSLKVHVKDLFWYITNYIINEILKWALQTAHLSQKWPATIFSTSKPILLIVYGNDLFWYITTIFNMKFLKWAPKSAQSSSNELKMSR